MNPNMSIYRRLNPRLLVQAEVGLGLLHWANMSNISLTVQNPLAMRVALFFFLVWRINLLVTNKKMKCSDDQLGTCASTRMERFFSEL